MTKILRLLRVIEPSTFFLVVTIFFGGLFLIATPPLQGPDEQAHFVQAYRVSEGKLGLSEPTSNSDKALPKSISETYKIIFYGSNDIRFDGNRKYHLGETKAALSIPLDQDNRQVSGYISGTGYSAIPYIPQAIMIALGRLFNLPPIVLIYLGRLGGLMAWVALLYLAIRLLPVGKWGATVMALVPMALFQASVISADTIPIGLLFLYIATILRFSLAKSSFSMRHVGILMSIATLMSLGKQILVIFTPLALLLALRGDGQKSTLRQKGSLLLKLAPIIIVPLLLAAMWTMYAGATADSSTSNMPKGVNPPSQIHHLVTHPTEFLFALWNTNFYTWGDGITRSIIGTFGWADTPTALSFTIAGFIMLAIVLFANRGADYATLPWVTKPRARGLITLLLAGYFIATSLAMYVYYSPVDFNIIVGLQGRYFLPLLPVLLLLAVNRDQLILKPGAYMFFSRLMPVALLTLSCIYIVIRYYLPTLI